MPRVYIPVHITRDPSRKHVSVRLRDDWSKDDAIKASEIRHLKDEKKEPHKSNATTVGEALIAAVAVALASSSKNLDAITNILNTDVLGPINARRSLQRDYTIAPGNWGGGRGATTTPGLPIFGGETNEGILTIFAHGLDRPLGQG